MNERVYNLVMRVIIAGLIIGMVGMIQPFSLTLFKPGFLILFYSTLAYIIFCTLIPGRLVWTSNSIRPQRPSFPARLPGPESPPASSARVPDARNPLMRGRWILPSALTGLPDLFGPGWSATG